MQEQLEFQPAYAMLTISLAEGEQVKAEPGAMVAQMNATMETKSAGGFFKGLKKMVVGGESFFLNTFTGGKGGGYVSLSPSAPGDIAWFDVEPGRQLFIQSGSFMGCWPNVETDTKFQGMRGFFSGESLFFIRAYTEDGNVGRVYYNSYGGIKPYPVQQGQTLVVDTGHIVAFEDTLQYDIGKVGGMKSLFFGGEGLVCNFTGEGTVWVQTRALDGLAALLAPFLPSASSSGWNAD